MSGVPFRLACIAASLAACGTGIARTESAPDSNEWLIQSWHVDEGLPDSSATAMVQTADGYLWFGTFSGLVRFDGVTFTVFDTDNTPQFPSGSIVNLYLDRSQRLWISTYAGLVVRDGARWLDFTKVPVLEDELIRTFAEKANGDLLLTTFHGKVVEFHGGEFAQYRTRPAS